MQQWYDEEFGPTGTANGGAYADKSYWICTEDQWEVIYAPPTYTGQNYPMDESVYGQSGGFGNGYVPLFIVVGYQNKVYYDDNDGCTAYDVQGLRTALRLAIDEMPQPPVMTISESSFSPSCAPDTSVADSFNIANSGSGPLNYSFSVDYDGAVAAGSTWHTNDFNSGIGYTVQSGWATYTGGTWNDGSQCADAADSSTPSVMTSATFNTTGVGDRLWLEFRYGTSYTTGSSMKAEYFNGNAWVEVWSIAESGVGTAKIELPVTAANSQLRFTSVMKRVTGTWSIYRLDNIQVYSDDQAYRWLLFDQVNSWGEPTATGTIASGNNLDFNLTFNAAGLAEGTYTADVMVHTNYPPEIHKAVPVTFTVSASGPVTPAVPANITTSIVSNDVFINWDDSADATSYDVYSSADPYGTFVYLTNVSVSEYTYTPTVTKMFFYIVAKNSTKESPRSIIVK